ncbi:uncharacterized protein K452DRAFT_300657 [Aplosporella prunicola CBS 121167]|uniref:TPR-like protein n=1 Tax=Aplosporella prunicola CBS 121167 TaxID=1176127 RepID=A0A6A6B783_9PEZI|nr:uncharacterized protein K452DRAFT_300657 [Aplosporella prunicola CBS 121167]KAF2139095.1 hypothetical protein K452DRAFT_300657 [Aplosporella prunicola CBS 121167]
MPIAMTSTSPHVTTQLRQLIYYHLDNDLLPNALFLAERLHGCDPRGPDAAHLLALCHFRLGRLKAAYDYSREKGLRGQHLGCAYVFAQACLGLERYGEGIMSLDRARGLWGGRNHWNKHSETSRRNLPDAAAVNCLLGKLWRAYGDTTKAIGCYIEALKLNPFMWDAFLDLCDTGAVVKTSNIFKMTPEMSAMMSTSISSNNTGAPPDSPPAGNPSVQTAQNGLFTPDPFNSVSRPGEPGLKLGGGNLFSRLNGGHNANASSSIDTETPVPNGGSHDEDVMMGEAGGVSRAPSAEPPHAPPRKARQVPSVADSGVDVPRMKAITARGRGKSGSEARDEVDPIKAPTGAQKRTISGNMPQSAVSSNPASQPRRSHRLMQSVQDHIRPSKSSTLPSERREAEARERQTRELRRARLPTTSKGTRSGTASGVGRVISGNRKAVDISDREQEKTRPPSVMGGSTATTQKPASLASAAAAEAAREREALQWLLDLFGKLGSGYYYLSRYSLIPALQTFTSLPAQHRDTPWVLAQIGRAHYEKAAYAESCDIFSKIKLLAPSRMEDMEVYSTVLWHLKRDTDLAHLAHELIEADRLCPQAWCAIGNSFSLQRDHDQAIRCFKRATQLNPDFAYAYTLQGHEHIANEEFDKALLAYRHAVAADSRHYNGWYGLGRVYERLGKYDIAEKHYKAAAQINPTNAVLIVCVGVVLEKSRKAAAALRQYGIACELDPRSALARFKKARALMNLRRPREALTELEILKDLAPDEANVHFMLGRLYKMMRDKTSAIRHFTIALNLDPKAAQYIKEAMETLEDEDELSEDD